MIIKNQLILNKKDEINKWHLHKKSLQNYNKYNIDHIQFLFINLYNYISIIIISIICYNQYLESIYS